MEDRRRLFEYFIIAGLNEQEQHVEFRTQQSENNSSNVEQKAPITDICIVFTSAGESTPAGYERIETTPSGYPANLNHGSLRSSAACFICYKRGYHKPPLIDLGILDESKGETAMKDAIVIDKTPYGLPANISNSSQGLYFTIRRAQTNAPPHQLVITEICIILENKGELPPHTYYKIPKNLSRSMLGSEVYVCYKKSQLVCKRIAYKPAVLDCFPQVKNTEDSILVQNVPKFFLPMGATIEAWPERCKGTEKTSIAKTFSTCVFTDEAYNNYYGASVTFYESYTNRLSESQKEKLDLGQDDQSTSCPEENQIMTNSKLNKKAVYYCNKAVCIVSRYPFFEPFRCFLYFLLNAVTIDKSKIPIERYISHLMYEVPFPSQTRPRILMELGTDMIAFESSDDSQIPLSGANFVETLKWLGVENLLYAMLLTLLEQKILVHSLRPWLLATVTETLCAIIFPFYWQLPYIPQCPLELAGIFHAPLSFMAGVDSRYFDLKDDPPSDVTCFDLDTGTISKSTVRKLYKLDLLPKKLLKRLRTALETIMQKNSGEMRNLKDPEQVHMHQTQSEFAIREAFLKFMCSLMDGYTDYLCPLLQPPEAGEATDFQRLFDWDHFLQSRDRNALEFYRKFRETICFTRFIEERSGAIMDRSDILDKSSYYVFFDDCIAKLKAVQFAKGSKEKSSIKEEINNLRLLDWDLMRANRTIVIQSPHILDPEIRNKEFSYESFPSKFIEKYFEKDLIFRSFENSNVQHLTENTPTKLLGQKDFYILRTRQEIRKSMLDISMLQQQNALYWPRSVLFFAYVIWFIQLPSLMFVTRNKRKMLIFALRVLSRMEQLGLPFHDQMCFRLVMQLCGENNHPEIAVQILRKMFRLGIIPNAITYKIYHRSLLQSEWPSQRRRKAIDAWNRLSIRLEVCARFHSFLPQNQNDTLDQQLQPKSSQQSQNEFNKASSIKKEEIIHEIGVLDVKEEEEYSNDQKKSDQIGENSISTDPLGAEMANSLSTSQSHYNQFEKQQQIKQKQTLRTTNSLKNVNSLNTKNPFISPSREKFIREHSVSPFSGENNEGGDKISLNSDKRKRKSFRATSWLKSIASNSPILNTLITGNSENLDRISRESSSINSDIPSISNSTNNASPNIFTLANKMKKAIRTYNDVLGPATELLERTGLNPTRMINEAKLNLSKSYRSADHSGLSTISSSHENLINTSGDFFFIYARRAKDILSINYWMQDILPEDDTELKKVWLRDGQNDKLLEEYLDVLICSSSLCSNCNELIYDDELTIGWTPDDANWNSICPHCQHSFLPSLKICIQIKQNQGENGECPNVSSSSNKSPSKDGKIVRAFTVPYISPLILRREIENLLANEGPLILSRPSVRISHPIIFWNIFYYSRRLELPTHILTWISPAVVIHCLQDMPKLPDEFEME